MLLSQDNLNDLLMKAATVDGKHPPGTPEKVCALAVPVLVREIKKLHDELDAYDIAWDAHASRDDRKRARATHPAARQHQVSESGWGVSLPDKAVKAWGIPPRPINAPPDIVWNGTHWVRGGVDEIDEP